MNYLIGFLTAVVLTATIGMFTTYGLITVIISFVVIGLFCLRERLIFDQYMMLFNSGYKEHEFNYLDEYVKLVLKFWVWDLIKYVDQQVEKCK